MPWDKEYGMTKMQQDFGDLPSLEGSPWSYDEPLGDISR